MMTQRFLFLLAAGIVMVSLIAPAIGKPSRSVKKGEKVFQTYCASCHAYGGNLLNDKHPVAESKQLASLGTFKQYLSEPPGHMPQYNQLINNPAELGALYEFCKTLKKPIKQACAPQ